MTDPDTNPYAPPRDASIARLPRMIMNVVWRVVVLTVAIPVSTFFLLDASICARPATDLLTGLQLGCYTKLEECCGLKEHAGCLRPIELIMGFCLLPVVAFVVLRPLFNCASRLDSSSMEESAQTSTR